MFVEQHHISSSIYVELCHSWKTLNSAKTTVKCTQIIVKLASGGIHTTCLKVHQTHLLGIFQKYYLWRKTFKDS